MDNKECRESAWFGAVAYKVIDPLEIAFRYEAFDDDIAGDQDGHLENRYSLGFIYTFYEKDSLAANLMAEYRRSDYEKTAGSVAEDSLYEVRSTRDETG